MQHKDKWALTFDEGGCRYGIMTTNAPELFNKVFKGIGVMPNCRRHRETYGPMRLLYNIRSAGGTNLGTEKYGGGDFSCPFLSFHNSMQMQVASHN
jgi:hypothetical protein